MGKAARISCIFVPMALTVAAGVLLVLVGLGQTNSNSQFLSDVYFLRANLSGAYNVSGINNIHKNNETVSSDVDSDGHIVLYNEYSVGLWNYCAGGGSLRDDTGPLDNTTDPSTSVAFCSPHEAQFAFDPNAVWGISSNIGIALFEGTFNGTLEKYEDGLGKAIGPLFIVTIASIAACIIVGLGAIFSRIGSLITTLVALFTTAVAFCFAVIATVAYFTLESAFNEGYKGLGINVHHGVNAFVFIWIAVACLLVGSLFWAFSSCCVSGRSKRSSHTKEVQYVGSSPVAYQRMEGSPQLGGGPSQGTAYGRTNGASYEPFRHT